MNFKRINFQILTKQYNLYNISVIFFCFLFVFMAVLQFFNGENLLNHSGSDGLFQRRFTFEIVRKERSSQVAIRYGISSIMALTAISLTYKSMYIQFMLINLIYAYQFLKKLSYDKCFVFSVQLQIVCELQAKLSILQYWDKIFMYNLPISILQVYLYLCITDRYVIDCNLVVNFGR